jgi:hypothetical protein
MMTPMKHRWVELPAKSGLVAWCNLCGTTKWVGWSGFWHPEKKVTFVTPWNHRNGDRNSTVLGTEPCCIEVEFPEDFQI